MNKDRAVRMWKPGEVMKITRLWSQTLKRPAYGVALDKHVMPDVRIISGISYLLTSTRNYHQQTGHIIINPVGEETEVEKVSAEHLPPRLKLELVKFLVSRASEIQREG